MKKTVAFIDAMMARLDFPEAAAQAFDRVYAAAGEDFWKLREDYLGDAGKFPAAVGSVAPIAAAMGEDALTVKMALSMAGADELHERYAARGISDEIFYRGMNDFRCKTVECEKLRGVWGSDVGGWFTGWYAMSRFALGRFQFELQGYSYGDRYTAKCGLGVSRGDPVLNFHIPSDGVPLSDEVRFDSYRRAREFYRDSFPDRPTAFVCNSWLLYPKHYKILPETMNIRRFMDDFYMIQSNEWPEDEALWRIFYADCRKPFAELPEDTALKRAYKKHLLEDGTSGSGKGIFLFDGERILR